MGDIVPGEYVSAEDIPRLANAEDWRDQSQPTFLGPGNVPLEEFGVRLDLLVALDDRIADIEWGEPGRTQYSRRSRPDEPR
jgi:hypothetical protein